MQLRHIEREHEAAIVAVDYFMQAVHGGQTYLPESLKRLNLRQLAERLEPTFVLRMFSDFELALRLYLTERHQVVPRTMKGKINLAAHVAGFRGAPVDGAHKARKFRNKVAHQSNLTVDDLSLRLVTRCLCTYLDAIKRW